MRVYEAKIVYSLISLGEEVTLDTPERVATYLESAYSENPMQEAFYVVLLDRKNHPLGRHMVTLGTLTSSLVHSRETFRAAIIGGAAAIVVSHNHPSGDPRPSSADLSVTRSLREASQILGIDLVDHVIVLSEHSDKTIYAECRIIPSWRRCHLGVRARDKLLRG
jgi:DNA repair protein RadC